MNEKKFFSRMDSFPEKSAGKKKFGVRLKLSLSLYRCLLCVQHLNWISQLQNTYSAGPSNSEIREVEAVSSVYL